MARMIYKEYSSKAGLNPHRSSRTPSNRIVGGGPHFYDPVKGDLHNFSGGKISTYNRFSLLDEEDVHKQ